MKTVASMVETFKKRHPWLAAVLSFERPCLATTRVVQENIRVTQRLVRTLEAAQDSITTLHERREALSEALSENDDCEYDAPTIPRRRATDRW